MRKLCVTLLIIIFILSGCNFGVSVEKKQVSIPQIKKMLAQEIADDPGKDGFEYIEVSVHSANEVRSHVVYESNQKILFFQKTNTNGNEKLATAQFKDGENFYVAQNGKLKKSTEVKLHTNIDEISQHLLMTLEQYEASFLEVEQADGQLWRTPAHISGKDGVIFKSLLLEYNEDKKHLSFILENDRTDQSLTYSFYFRQQQTIDKVLDELADEKLLVR